MWYRGLHPPNSSLFLCAFCLLALVANCRASEGDTKEFSKTSGYDSNFWLGYFDFALELLKPKTYLGLLQYPLLLNSLGKQKQAPRTASAFKDEYDFIVRYHGTKGLLTVERHREDGLVRRSIYKGAKELGYPIVDPNAQRLTGFADFQSTIRNQQRCSVAKAYLVPAENRTNLDIISRAFVRKIPVIADLPVGENFHDHPSAIMQYELKQNISLVTTKSVDPKNVQDYLSNRKGPLSTPSLFSATAFLNGSFVNPERDFPNIQMSFLEHSEYVPTKPYFNMKREVFDQVYKPYFRKPILACVVESLQPRSRGTVRLSSTDPYDPPLVDPNYMADEKDINDVVQGMKICDKVTSTNAMKAVVEAPFSTLYPGCEEFANDKDLYYKCQVKSVIVSTAHPVGTAKMGDVNDPTTVVDSQLRVKHVKGLRVIDGSIIPKIPSSNTNAPIIMIAEKASDIVKKELKC